MEQHTVSKLLKIGALASKAGLSRDTIRFYEREALLPKAPRTPAGFRLYSAEALTRLHFIKHAQALGLSLTEIRLLLGGYQDPEECRQVKQLLEQKIAVLDEQLQSIRALRATLQRYLEACQEALRDSEVRAPCPVLALLIEQAGVQLSGPPALESHSWPSAVAP
jgi:DNA-binding transcriptional MerR regulator